MNSSLIVDNPSSRAASTAGLPQRLMVESREPAAPHAVFRASWGRCRSERHNRRVEIPNLRVGDRHHPKMNQSVLPRTSTLLQRSCQQAICRFPMLLAGPCRVPIRAIQQARTLCFHHRRKSRPAAIYEFDSRTAESTWRPVAGRMQG